MRKVWDEIRLFPVQSQLCLNSGGPPSGRGKAERNLSWPSHFCILTWSDRQPEVGRCRQWWIIRTPINSVVKNQVEYDETIWNARDALGEERLEAKLKRQAKQLGYELVPIEPKAA